MSFTGSEGTPRAWRRGSRRRNATPARASTGRRDNPLPAAANRRRRRAARRDKAGRGDENRRLAAWNGRKDVPMKNDLPVSELHPSADEIAQRLRAALEQQRAAYFAHPVPTLAERKADLRTL